MDITVIREDVKQQLSQERYAHTLRVVDEALMLAYRYDVSVVDAELAALLHDYAKCFSKTNLHDEIMRFSLPEDLLNYHHELWHGPVGAAISREKYAVSEDIYHAIYYHTAARKNMSHLELIIFVADYIEPARDFPGVNEVREIAKVNLEQAAQKALQNTLSFLLRQNALVYPDSILAYNALTNQCGSGK